MTKKDYWHGVEIIAERKSVYVKLFKPEDDSWQREIQGMEELLAQLHGGTWWGAVDHDVDAKINQEEDSHDK